MAKDLTSKMTALRVELAEAILPSLEADQHRVDAGSTANAESRKRTAEHITWWSGEAK